MTGLRAVPCRPAWCHLHFPRRPVCAELKRRAVPGRARFITLKTRKFLSCNKGGGGGCYMHSASIDWWGWEALNGQSIGSVPVPIAKRVPGATTTQSHSKEGNGSIVSQYSHHRPSKLLLLSFIPPPFCFDWLRSVGQRCAIKSERDGQLLRETRRLLVWRKEPATSENSHQSFDAVMRNIEKKKKRVKAGIKVHTHKTVAWENSLLSLFLSTCGADCPNS